jgi:hypothetical protein
MGKSTYEMKAEDFTIYHMRYRMARPSDDLYYVNLRNISERYGPVLRRDDSAGYIHGCEPKPNIQTPQDSISLLSAEVI